MAAQRLLAAKDSDAPFDLLRMLGERFELFRVLCLLCASELLSDVLGVTQAGEKGASPRQPSRGVCKGERRGVRRGEGGGKGKRVTTAHYLSHATEAPQHGPLEFFSHAAVEWGKASLNLCGGTRQAVAALAGTNKRLCPFRVRGLKPFPPAISLLLSVHVGEWRATVASPRWSHAGPLTAPGSLISRARPGRT